MDVVFKEEKKQTVYSVGQRIALANARILRGFSDLAYEYSLKLGTRADTKERLDKEALLRFDKLVDDAMVQNNLTNEVRPAPANVNFDSPLFVPQIKGAIDTLELLEKSIYNRENGFGFADFVKVHEGVLRIRSALADAKDPRTNIQLFPVTLRLVELRTS